MNDSHGPQRAPSLAVGCRPGHDAPPGTAPAAHQRAPRAPPAPPPRRRRPLPRHHPRFRQRHGRRRRDRGAAPPGHGPRFRPLPGAAEAQASQPHVRQPQVHQSADVPGARRPGCVDQSVDGVPRKAVDREGAGGTALD